MRNPFETLGMTTALVNALKHKPDVLKKIANQNWKQLQKVFHPDIYGDDYFSIELNKAMDLLDNDMDFQDYVEYYVSFPDAEKMTVREKKLLAENTALEKRLELLRQHIVEEQETLSKKDKGLELFQKIAVAKDNLNGLFFISALPDNLKVFFTVGIDKHQKNRFISTSKKYSLTLRNGGAKALCFVEGRTRCYRLKEYTKAKKMKFPRIGTNCKYLLGCAIGSNFSVEQVLRRTDLRTVLGKITPYFVIGKNVIAIDCSGPKVVLHDLGILEKVRIHGS